MLALLSKAFGMSSPSQVDATLKPREILFSAAKLQFSMPENFSLDFPADDLVDQVDENDSRLYEKYGNTLLLRRWWDFFEPTFFSKKEVGTIMMSITVHKSKVEYKSRFELLTVLLKRMEEVHGEFNKTVQPDSQIFYPDSYSAIFEDVYNQQRWLSYNLVRGDDTNFTRTYVMPLNSQYYTEISFEMGISPMLTIKNFFTTYGKDLVENIMNSTHMKYEDTGLAKTLGVDASSQNLSAVLLEKSK